MSAARARSPRSRGDRGSGLIEMTWLGILLLVPLVWILLSVFTVQRGSFAVSGAARAAGRAYALAPTDELGVERARAAARQVLADQGLADVPFDLTVSCTPYPHSCHSGTSVVTVRVGGSVRIPVLPFFLGGGAPRFALDASDVVPIGQYHEVTHAS